MFGINTLGALVKKLMGIEGFQGKWTNQGLLAGGTGLDGSLGDLAPRKKDHFWDVGSP